MTDGEKNEQLRRGAKGRKEKRRKKRKGKKEGKKTSL